MGNIDKAIHWMSKLKLLNANAELEFDYINDRAYLVKYTSPCNMSRFLVIIPEYINIDTDYIMSKCNKNIEINLYKDIEFVCKGEVLCANSLFKSICNITNLTRLRIKEMNSSKCRDFTAAFYKINVNELDLAGMDTSGAVTMDYMFSDMHIHGSIDFGCMDVANVTSMRSMFYSAVAVKYKGFEMWDTRSLKNCEKMFHDCNIDYNPFVYFDLASVENAKMALYPCECIDRLELKEISKIKCNNLVVIAGEILSLGISAKTTIKREIAYDGMEFKGTDIGLMGLMVKYQSLYITHRYSVSNSDLRIKVIVIFINVFLTYMGEGINNGGKVKRGVSITFKSCDDETMRVDGAGILCLRNIIYSLITKVYKSRKDVHDIDICHVLSSLSDDDIKCAFGDNWYNIINQLSVIITG